MSLEQEQHVDNLATALQIIAKIGKLYNGLERKDQKDLLRQVVRRVVIDECGKVALELKSPFEYLRNLADEVRSVRKKLNGNKVEKKNGGQLSAISPRSRSNLISSGVPGEIRTPDPLLRRQMLYPLSYRHIMSIIVAQ